MNIVQQRIRTFRFTDRLIDLILLFISIYTVALVERIYNTRSFQMIDVNSLNYFFFIIIIIWIILIQIFEHDLVYRRIAMWQIIRNALFISFIGVTTSITVDILLELEMFNRLTIALFGLFSFFLLSLKRCGMKYFLSYIRHEGFDPKNILIIGSHKRAKRLILEFNNHREYGIRIQSILDPDPRRTGKNVAGLNIVGDMSQFQKQIHEKEIDEVFFALGLSMIPNSEDIFKYLDTIGVSYHIMLNESVHIYTEKYLNIVPNTSSYYGIPMVTFNSISANHIKLYIKNCIEKILAFILLILFLPILLLFGVLIKCTSTGSILFKQERVGLHGRKFYQYKLRSMIAGADSLKDQYAHLNEQSGPIFKIKEDPRLTGIGRFIRKFSIDELPQLINILMGSMTLIGPRPPLPLEVENYKDIHLRRLSMKPGITGLWQVSGRNSIKDFDEWVGMDLEYIDNWSFALDIKIAFKTIRTVISGTGM